MLLLSRKKTKPGAKKIVWWSLKPQLKIQSPRLSLSVANSGGRGLCGSKTIRTRTSTRRRRFLPLFNMAQGVYNLFLVVLAQKITLKSRLVFLLRSSLGFWSFLPAFSGAVQLSYVQSQLPHIKSTGLEPYQTYIPWWFRLDKITPFSTISWVVPNSDSFYKYARALGSSCKLIIPKVNQLWALIMLPSGRLTFIKKDIYVFLGPSEALEHSKPPFHSAGARQRLGFRPMVRGVAKNPNDHPHGGRASSIKYPRTPWGKTAKYPRREGLVFKFKRLDKRQERSDRTHVQPYWL